MHEDWSCKIFKIEFDFYWLDMIDYKLKFISQLDLSKDPFWIAGDKDRTQFATVCMDHVADQSMVLCWLSHIV